MSIHQSRRTFLISLGAGASVGVAGCGQQSGGPQDGDNRSTTAEQARKTVTILAYSGAGLRKPMEAVAEAFEAETGHAVNYKFAGSNTLLSQIELNKQGDVYVPGAKYYIDQADKKGFIADRALAAHHTPTIITPEGNPADIQGLSDLTNDDVTVALGNPEAAAIGRLAKRILKQNDLYAAVEENLATTAGTTNELVVYTTQHQVDAAITWRADVHGLEDETDRVPIAEERNIIKTIPVGTLTFADHPEVAAEFVEFTATKGKDVFSDFGYVPYRAKT